MVTSGALARRPEPPNTQANENAIRAARLYTGRQKILSSYRSYHGATNACMQLTGDPRRMHNEPGGPGYVHVMPPWPYEYSFGAAEKRWTRPPKGWAQALNQLALHFEGRLPV